MHTAIITGTTRGLGHALADAFTTGGWAVVPLNRPEFDLQNFDAAKLEKTLRDIEQTGRVVLVNNAATHHIQPVSSISPEVIRREIEVNITGQMTLISTFLRAFPSGEIANITSSAATTPFAHWSLYGAAKAAMNSFIEALKVEGVKCFNLNPGAVATDMQTAIAASSSPLPDGIQLRPPAMVAKNLAWQISRAE